MHMRLRTSTPVLAAVLGVFWGCVAAAPLSAQPARTPRGPVAVAEFEPAADDRADDLYSAGREAIEQGRYDRALDAFDTLIELKSTRTDAGLYWKAYSLAKLGRRDDAIA